MENSLKIRAILNYISEYSGIIAKLYPSGNEHISQIITFKNGTTIYKEFVYNEGKSYYQLVFECADYFTDYKEIVPLDIEDTSYSERFYTLYNLRREDDEHYLEDFV